MSLNALASGLADPILRSSTRALRSPAAIALAAFSIWRSCCATGLNSRAIASAAGSKTIASVVVADFCPRSKSGNGPNRNAFSLLCRALAANQRADGGIRRLRGRSPIATRATHRALSSTGWTEPGRIVQVYQNPLRPCCRGEPRQRLLIDCRSAGMDTSRRAPRHGTCRPRHDRRGHASRAPNVA